MTRRVFKADQVQNGEERRKGEGEEGKERGKKGKERKKQKYLEDLIGSSGNRNVKGKNPIPEIELRAFNKRQEQEAGMDKAFRSHI